MSPHDILVARRDHFLLSAFVYSGFTATKRTKQNLSEIFRESDVISPLGCHVYPGVAIVASAYQRGLAGRDKADCSLLAGSITVDFCAVDKWKI